MEDNMVNEVMESVVPDIVEKAKSKSGNGLAIANVIGWAVVGGFTAYDRIVKPLIKRHKEKKELKKESKKAEAAKTGDNVYEITDEYLEENEPEYYSANDGK